MQIQKTNSQQTFGMKFKFTSKQAERVLDQYIVGLNPEQSSILSHALTQAQSSNSVVKVSTPKYLGKGLLLSEVGKRGENNFAMTRQVIEGSSNDKDFNISYFRAFLRKLSQPEKSQEKDVNTLRSFFGL